MAHPLDPCPTTGGARRPRRLRRPRLALGAALACMLVAAGVTISSPARAATNPCVKPHVTNFLGADATKPGVIDLYFFHAEGATVSYFECIGDRAQPLGQRTTPAGTPTILYGATTWSCARVKRRFVATATRAHGSLATGQFGVRTMSCAQRFELSAPRRVAVGSRLAIRVTDRWAIGGMRPQLCIAAPHAARTCKTLAFARAVAIARRSVRADVPGDWRVELRAHGHVVRTTVAVGGDASTAPAAPPTLLATGDSMMQGIDGFLTDDLGDGVRVRSDVRPGTAIGKTAQWLDWSAAQAKRFRPAVTVIAIGANEGFAMATPAGATVACCGDAWVAEYTRRVRTMMRTYRRHGRGRVVWLTLPAPRDGRLTPVFAAVNRAILAAAAGMADVSVLRIDELFTPDGYRAVMRYRGRDVRVREPDGVHLNISGTSIAAAAITKLLAALAR